MSDGEVQTGWGFVAVAKLGTVVAARVGYWQCERENVIGSERNVQEFKGLGLDYLPGPRGRRRIAPQVSSLCRYKIPPLEMRVNFRFEGLARLGVMLLSNGWKVRTKNCGKDTKVQTVCMEMLRVGATS